MNTNAPDYPIPVSTIEELHSLLVAADSDHWATVAASDIFVELRRRAEDSTVHSTEEALQHTTSLASVLFKAVKFEDDRKLRLAALRGLGALGTTLSEMYSDSIVVAVGVHPNQTGPLQREAALVFGHMATTSDAATETLVWWALASPNDEVREASRWSLGRVGPTHCPIVIEQISAMSEPPLISAEYGTSEAVAQLSSVKRALVESLPGLHEPTRPAALWLSSMISLLLSIQRADIRETEKRRELAVSTTHKTLQVNADQPVEPSPLMSHHVSAAQEHHPEKTLASQPEFDKDGEAPQLVKVAPANELQAPNIGLTQTQLPSWPIGFVAVLLFLAVLPWPYSYYTFLRAMVVAGSVYACFSAVRQAAIWRIPFYGGFTLVFVFFSMPRSQWFMMDIVGGIAFSIGAYIQHQGRTGSSAI